MRELIEAATNLKVIGRAGIGTDNVDKDAASKAGIIVMNTPFGNMITTAEHAIAMMLALNRQLMKGHARVLQGNYSLSGLVGFDMHGKTVGVIGTGKIGR